jgi:membrane protease YdiL (CAAX protease family)
VTGLRRPGPAFVVAWALFLAALLAPDLAEQLGVGTAPPAWVPHALVKTTLLGLSLAGIALAGGRWSEWGFRRAADARWGRFILRGGALGAATSAVIILSPARGMHWLRELGFAGLVVWIWIHSSVSEEVFVRGWFQGFVRPEGSAPLRIGPLSLDKRCALSALLFGSMHLPNVRYGADAWTLAIVVSATTALGWLAARDRARSGSLGPPIATHVAFNVGGMVGAILTTLAVVVASGEPPQI